MLAKSITKDVVQEAIEGKTSAAVGIMDFLGYWD
jgi:hypothetical protein